MIRISLDEKNAIRNVFKDVHIVRTMKQKSHRHRYYMAEEPGPMRMLRRLRGEIDDRNNSRNPKRNGKNNRRKGA